MDNKYIIQVPGDEHVAEWPEERFNANKDALMSQYPDAQINVVRQYNADDDIEDTDNFIISVPGDNHVAQWDSKRFAANRDRLIQDYPDAQISVSRPVDYWGPKLAEQQQALDTFNESDDAKFRKEYEDALNRSVAFESQRARTRSTEKNPDVDYLDANRERYFSVNKEYKRLQEDYYSNPIIRGYYDEKAAISGNTRDSYRAEADKGGDDSKSFKRAAKLQDDITKLYSQPISQIEDESLRTFLKDYGSGMKTTFTDKDFWTRGLSAIGRNLEIRDIQKKLNEGQAALGRELTEDDIDRILTPGDKALLNSFRDLSMALYERAENLPLAYNAGQGAAESLGFMAEFLLSGAVTKGIGAALSKSNSALAKWLGREMQISVMSPELDVARAMEQDVTKMGALRKAMYKTFTEPQIRSAELMAERTSGMSKGRDFAYRYITKPVAEAATNMMFQPMTYRSLSENLTRVNDNGELIGIGNATVNTLFDQLIEVWSESMGGVIEKGMGLVSKGGAWLLDKSAGRVKIGNASISDLVRYFGDSRFASLLRESGFNGFVGEILEEYLGSAARLGVTALSNNVGQGKIQLMTPEEFNEQMWKGKDGDFSGLLEMAASFGLMSGISLVGNTRNMLLSAAEYNRLAAKMKERMAANGVSDDEINNVFDKKYATSKDIAEAFMPYYQKMMTDGSEQDQKDAMTLLYLMGQSSVINEYNAQQEIVRRYENKNALDAKMNNAQWWMDTDDGQIVKRYVDKDGIEGYVIGQTEDGRDIVNFADGRKRFIGDAERGNEQFQISEPVTLYEFLDTMEAENRKQQEQMRMASEEQQQMNDVRSSVQQGQQFNIGTVESPNMVSVIQTSDNGVVVMDENQQTAEIGWDKVAEYIGKPIDVKSDSVIESEGAKAASTLEDMRKKADAVAKAAPAIVEKDGAVYTILAVPSVTDTENGTVFNAWATDEAGRSVNITLSNDDVSQMVSAFDTGAKLPTDDNISEAQQSELSEQPAAETDNDGVLRDFGGNAIPLNQDGSVDQNAFWNSDPEAWARWKTEQLGDGGAYAVDYIGKAVRKLQQTAAELGNSVKDETDFDKLGSIEGKISDINERISQLEDVAVRVAGKAAATGTETVQNDNVQNTEAPAAAASASSSDEFAGYSDEDLNQTIASIQKDIKKEQDKVSKPVDIRNAGALKAREDARKKVEELNAELERFNAVKERRDNAAMDAAAQKAQEDAEARRLEELARETGDVPFDEISRTLDEIEPDMDFENLVRKMLYGSKIIWKTDGTHIGLKDQIISSGTDANSDRLKYIGWLANKDKGGRYLADIIHSIYQNLPQSLLDAGYDDVSVRDVVLSALQEYNSPAAMLKGIYDNLVTRRNKAELEHEQMLKDEFAREQGFTDYEEYITFEEAWNSGELFAMLTDDEINDYYSEYGDITETGIGQGVSGVVQTADEQDSDNEGSSGLGNEQKADIEAGVRQGTQRGQGGIPETRDARDTDVVAGAAEEGRIESDNERQDNLAEAEVNAKLSNELDEFNKPFVISSDGSTIFGEVSDDSGLTAAPIKLSLGENTVDEKGENHGYGLLHILAGHGKQILDAGFSSVEEFVESVAKNYDTIREGSIVANNQTYLLEISDEHNNTLFVQLSRDGSYWNINSAGIFKTKYSRNKVKVYTRPAVEPGTNTNSSGVNNGNNNGVTAPAGNSPQTSADKYTQSSESASNQQEKSHIDVELNGQLYNIADLERQFRDDIEMVFNDNGIDAEVVGVKLIGSRIEGSPRTDSDLDLLVEYKGDYSEDSLFNLLNGEEFEINGVKLDINPITEGKSGTIEQFLKRNSGYRKEEQPADEAQEYEDFLQGQEKSDVMKTAKEQASKSIRKRSKKEKKGETEDVKPESSTVYGDKNTIVTKERYEELKKKLRGKLNNLNAGFDPETFAIGCEMAAYHMEAGARSFVDFCKRMISDIGDAVRPYLKSFYNGARDLPGMEELSKLMDTYESVSSVDVNSISIDEGPEPTPTGTDGTDDTEDRDGNDTEGSSTKFKAGDKVVFGGKEMTVDSVNKDGTYNLAYDPSGFLPVYSMGIDESKLSAPATQEQLEKIQEMWDGLTPEEQRTVTEELQNDENSIEQEHGVQMESMKETPAYSEIGEVIKDKNTKTGEDIWVVKPSQRVGNDVFKSLRDAAKSNNGYWSTFKHGFLFKSEEDANNFNNSNIKGYEQTNEQREASTAAIVSEAGAVEAEADAVAKDDAASESQIQHEIDRIDSSLAKIDDKLAVLGYYEADPTSEFHEQYGFMKSAEKKAVSDMKRLAKSISTDLGVDAKSVKVYSNVAPAGGEVTTRIPLLNGKELYVLMYVEPVRTERDDIRGLRFMWRIEEPSATGYMRYGSNQFEDIGVTYRTLIGNIKRIARNYIPEQTTEITDIAKDIAKKNRKKKQNDIPLSGDELFGDLFTSMQAENNSPAPVENTLLAPEPDHHGYKVGDKVRYEYPGREAQDVTITGFDEHDGRPVLDTFGALWITELGEWEYVKPIVNENTDSNGRLDERNTSDNGEVGTGERQETERTDGRGVDRGNGTGLGSDEGRGSSSSGSDKDDVGKKEPAPKKNTHNNHQKKGEVVVPKSPAARFKANVEAIKVMRRLIDSEQNATKDDMAVLRQFTGWGGLGGVFKNVYSPEYTELKNLLTPEEFDNAVMSVNSAYFTPEYVVDSLWDIARQLGFEGGRILEGSAGIGNILAVMPKNISEASDITAVEIDGITGNILKLLYPDADVQIKGFQDVAITSGTVDLAITNVPFVTGLKVIDPLDKDLSNKFANIHDFCIAKNLRKLREGGIGIFITTKGTLDSSSSKKLRSWITNEGGCDVIGAYRLNNETFEGTNVTSDIIVVRKRIGGVKSAQAIDITGVQLVRDAVYEDKNNSVYNYRTGEYTIPKVPVVMEYNGYFVEHPENMGGEMAFAFEKGDTFRPTSVGLYPAEKINQDKSLSKWVKGFNKEDAVKEVQNNDGKSDTDTERVSGKEGQIYVDEAGRVCILRGGIPVPLEGKQTKVKGYERKQVVADYDKLKKALQNVLDTQMRTEDEAELGKVLKQLNDSYDTFVKRYGRLNNNVSLSWLREDVNYASTSAIESFKEIEKDGKKEAVVEKTDVFRKRVLGVKAEPKPKNISDAVLVSISRNGKISVPYIAELLGMSEEKVRQDILASRMAYENPQTGEIEPSYIYLSGNVREKYQYAVEMNRNGVYDSNIEALKKVIPADIPSTLIDFSIGSDWIDSELYDRFCKEKYDVEIHHKCIGGKWMTDKVSDWEKRREKNRMAGVHSDIIDMDAPGSTLMLCAMNNTPFEFSKIEKHSDGTSATIKDQKATDAAAVRVQEIRDEFKEWCRNLMYENTELADRLAARYNETFNNYAPVVIGSEFIPQRFEGSVITMGGKPFELRPHQKNAVIRSTIEPVLLAHEVGTGKTFTLISAAMEMKRLGTAQKPMIVVQNATVGQFVTSAKELYPNAKILTVSDKDRTKEGRLQFYAKIKYNDWDMIIVPQSVFEMMPDSPERRIDFITEKIEEKMAALVAAREENIDSRQLSSMEKELSKLTDDRDAIIESIKTDKKGQLAINNASVKARKQLDRRQDAVDDFDKMGIDALLVDEAHAYKRLGFETAIKRGVKGVDKANSKRSAGVYMKLRSIFDRCGWRNVVFATGTPISNTAAEIWTFMKYLMKPDVMKANHIYNFDDFVRNFGNISQNFEHTTSGKVKDVTRFAAYNNVPELVRIWASVSDTVRSIDADSGDGSKLKDKVPELEEGKAEDKFLEQTPSLIGIMNSVRAELEAFEKMSGKEKQENSYIPLVMFGIAKRAAIDARLVDANAADEPGSKTNVAVKDILDDLKQTKDYNGTVAVFCDNYRRVEGGVESFNLFEDVKSKLIANGVPESQIVIMRADMSTKKKEQIFASVNSGDIRVIMGTTQTLGTGVNIQERLHMAVHIDAPIRPMDYTQRNGRILRQGNLHRAWNKTVKVIRYGVKDSLDVTAYQRLKTKASFIDSIMNGKKYMSNSMEDRTLEEEEEGMFDNPVAVLSGSQYAIELTKVERELRKYTGKKEQYRHDQIYIQNQTRNNTNRIASIDTTIAKMKDVSARFKQAFPDGKPKAVTINGKKYVSNEELQKGIREFVSTKIKAIADEVNRNSWKYTIRTQAAEYYMDFDGIKVVVSVMAGTKQPDQSGNRADISYRFYIPEIETSDNHVYFSASSIKNIVEQFNSSFATGIYFESRISKLSDEKERLISDNAIMEQRRGKAFEFDDKIKELTQRADEVREAMKAELKANEEKYAAISTEKTNLDDISYDDEEDETSGDAEAMVSGEEETLSTDTDAKQWVVDELMSMLGDDVQIVSQEDADREAYGTSAERMAKEKMLENLSKASRFVSESLYGKRQGASFTIELPASTRRMIKRVMGTDFDSHSITANSIVHSKNNHGENGKKNTSKSIPLRDEDFSLAPYIMTAPTRIEKGSMDASGRNSIRFVYELSNGYVVVVEKEQKNSPDDMETITMWAEMSDGVADARNTSPAIDVQNVISNIDAAKIRKDAENAIENDSKSEKAELMVAYHGTGADIFISNAEAAVSRIKQDKATPAQWKAMLTKEGGLKAGEDKWLGLSEWLDSSDTKTITKQEIQDFIAKNAIQIEETSYEEAPNYSFDDFGGNPYIDKLESEFDNLRAENGGERAFEILNERHPGIDAFAEQKDGGLVWDYDEDLMSLWMREDIGIKTDRSIERVRLNYTTEGLDNKREIALTVPTIDPWNRFDEVHFGDAGEGRAVAWIRFGETELVKDADPNLLKEYENAIAAYHAYRKYLHDKYGKKWGVKVQDISLPGLQNEEGWHSVDVTPEMRESVMQGQPMFSRNDKTVYGYAKNGKIYLTKEGLNPNTPIHEYTHLWAKAMQKYNPEGWNDIVKLLKGTPVWEQVVNDESYQNLKDDDAIASEVLSRISGKKNAEKMIAEAEKAIAEADGVLEKAKAISLRERMKRALDKFWNWVGTNLFGMRFDSIDEVTDRVLWDLVNGTDLGEDTSDESEFSIRTKPAPKKTGIGYKVFFKGKDGKLYPPMVANNGGVDTPVGVWLDAEEGAKAPDSKTGRPQVKQGGKGTQGGSGTLAYRPGWHLGKIPYALQFNRKDENGNKTLFPKDFVWAEVEYAMDRNYQDEAMKEGTTANGKFQHSLAGLKRLPEDGYYEYRTNPNPATDPWIITGAMKVNKVLTKDEVDELVREAGREPQKVEGSEIHDRGGYHVADRRTDESSEDFIRRVIDDFNGLYNQQCEIHIVNPYVGKEEYGKITGKSGEELDRSYDNFMDVGKNAMYIAGKDIILIKAFDDYSSGDDVLETILHENIHSAILHEVYKNGIFAKGNEIAGKYSALNKAAKKLYDYIVSNIENDENYKEIIDAINGRNNTGETLANILAYHMVGYRTDWMYSVLDDTDKIAVNNVINRIGYDGRAQAKFQGVSGSLGEYAEGWQDAGSGYGSSRSSGGGEDGGGDGEPGRLVSKSEQAQLTADRLGVNVEFVSRDQMPSGHKWSMGVWQDGRILVCPENNPSADEAVKTVLHEAVGHEGLRRLVGKDYVQSFCMELYRMLPQSRKDIIDIAAKNRDWNPATAVEEYLAEQAQNFNMEEEFRENFFDKVRAVLRNILSKMGIDIPLSERDIRWLLYQNYYALHNNLRTEANRARLAHRLGLSESALKVRAEARGWILDRTLKDTFSAARLYNNEVATLGARLHETVVDQFDAVNKLVDAIEKASGKVAKAFEDIRLALNQQSSKAFHDMTEWTERYWSPLSGAVRSISEKTGRTVEQIERYMMLKHGVERNIGFAKRDAESYYRNVHDVHVESIKNDKSLSEEDIKSKIAKEDEKLQRHIDKIDAGTDPLFIENRKKDYGGLTGLYSKYPSGLKPYNPKAESIEEYYKRVLEERVPMFDNVADMEDAARKEIGAFEKEAGAGLVSELWKRTNAATKATLKHQYDHNMLSREQYEHIKGMFEYYVPLRGFDDETAGDLYSYYTTQSGNQFQAPVLTAKGRTTRAGSPLGYIGAQASSGIAQDYKNDSKLALWYFVNNRADNDLVTISETWYRKKTDEDGNVVTDEDGKDVYEPVYPPFREGLSSEDAKTAYRAWENEMKALRAEGMAYHGIRDMNKQHLQYVINQTKGERNSHIVTLKVGGSEKFMFINGSPRAAQAINNELNVNVEDSFRRLFGPLNRFFSNINTSMNPEFWISNLQRDIIFALMTVDVKEDKEYNKAYHKNMLKAVSAVKMNRAYGNGTLGDGYIEKMYREFIENGGVTGYSTIIDREKWEADVRKFSLKNKTLFEKVEGGFDAVKSSKVFESIAEMSDGIEQINRFCAFLTSREMGKDVRQSIADAKELTINFNRKGSGKPITFEEAAKLRNRNGEPLNWFEQLFAVAVSKMNRLGRLNIIFWNAGIQAINAIAQLAKANPKKLAFKWGGTMLALGAINAALHAMLDDDDDYLDIPDYERHNNLLIGGKGHYFKWALPQETRVLYGMGDMMVTYMMGRYPHKDFLKESGKMISEVSPLDLSEGKWWFGFVPTYLRPFAEILANKNFAGSPIYRDSRYMSDAEKKATPNWNRAYQSTGTVYVDISRMLDFVTGGDEITAGKINIHPEVLEHLVEGVTGGAGTSVAKGIRSTYGNILYLLTDGEKGNEPTVRNTPFLSRILTVNDERYRNSYVNDLYWYYKGLEETTSDRIKKYINAGDIDKATEIMNSDDYEASQLYNRYSGSIKIYDEMLELTTNRKERRELTKEQDAIKAEMVKKISNIGKEN